MCVMGIDGPSVSTMFSLDFGIAPTVWYFMFYHFDDFDKKNNEFKPGGDGTWDPWFKPEGDGIWGPWYKPEGDGTWGPWFKPGGGGT